MGHIDVNQPSHAAVATQLRAASAKNHSATHLLHAALRQYLGDDVTQKGSLVNSELLRFDFSYDQPLSAQDLVTIENMVNQQILANQPAKVELLTMDEAKAKGAMALFGEKYGDTVRVLSMGTTDSEGRPFSIELCGGLHVQRTGDIGLFKIISEQGIAAGVRRIEAMTGMGAVKYVQQGEQQLSELASQLKAKRPEIAERVSQLADKTRDLEKQLERLQQKLASAQAKTLLDDVQTLNGHTVLVAQVADMDGKALRTLSDDVKSRLPNAVIVLSSVHDDKVAVTASVDKTLTSHVKAGDIIKHVTAQLGGKGGGKPDFAQGGASDIAGLPAVLAALPTWLGEKLS